MPSSFSRDGARRIVDAVTFIENYSKNPAPRLLGGSPSSPIINVATVTSTTLVNGFYPAKLQALDPSAGVGGTWNDLSPTLNALLVNANGNALTNGSRYGCRLAGTYYDGSTTRPVYVVTAECCGGGCPGNACGLTLPATLYLNIAYVSGPTPCWGTSTKKITCTAGDVNNWGNAPAGVSGCVWHGSLFWGSGPCSSVGAQWFIYCASSGCNGLTVAGGSGGSCESFDIWTPTSCSGSPFAWTSNGAATRCDVSNPSSTTINVTITTT